MFFSFSAKPQEDLSVPLENPGRFGAQLDCSKFSFRNARPHGTHAHAVPSRELSYRHGDEAFLVAG
jgi:hypothetical protein